jgi:DNA polymerase III alpha subunit (gram-positive type)
MEGGIMLCVDCETGGLDPYTCGICTVSMKVVGKDIKKTIFIKPTKNRIYSEKAFEVNGLSLPELEEKGVSEQEAIKQIIDFIITNFPHKKPNVLAHNAIFDLQFLNALFKRNGFALFTDYCYYHPQDTMIIMKFLQQAGLTPGLNKVNLGSCYKYFFHKDIEQQHTSAADVEATEKVYFKIIEFLKLK